MSIDKIKKYDNSKWCFFHDNFLTIISGDSFMKSGKWDNSS